MSEHLCEFRDKLCEALGRELVLKNEIERLRADKDVERSQARNSAYEAEIERLLRVCKDKTTLLKDAYAGNERRDAEIELLQAALKLIAGLGRERAMLDATAIAKKALVEPTPGRKTG